METTATVETQISDLAIRYPAASRLFFEYGIDYCCGGKRSLAEACRDQRVDPAHVLRLIQEAPVTRKARDWSTAPLSRIVRHIVDVYHRPLPGEMQDLVGMAEKVEEVHADKRGCPRGLVAHLAVLARTLDAHMRQEEGILFPAILDGRGGRATSSVRVLEAEHRDVGLALETTRLLTTDLVPPGEACATWSALYMRLRDLERSLMEHIHLENNVLFPRALLESGTALS